MCELPTVIALEALHHAPPEGLATKHAKAQGEQINGSEAVTLTGDQLWIHMAPCRCEMAETMNSHFLDVSVGLHGILRHQTSFRIVIAVEMHDAHAKWT